MQIGSFITLNDVSETENFWAGDFGDQYTERNQIRPVDREPFFREVLSHTSDLQSICELGSNRGHNLQALQMINPSLDLAGVEINSAACREMQGLPGIHCHQSSIAGFAPGRRYDLVFTSGVLIHIAPDHLYDTFDKIERLCSKYVLINEYFSPSPVAIPYRGFSGRLFKRDFAGDFLERFPVFEAAAYGFLWKRIEPAWDNSNWTLLRRVDGR